MGGGDAEEIGGSAGDGRGCREEKKAAVEALRTQECTVVETVEGRIVGCG